MSRSDNRPVAKAALVTAALTAAAAWPAYAWAGSDGVLALLAAAASALVGALAGRLAQGLVPRTGPEADVAAAMASLGVRLLGTAAIALAVLLWSPLPRLPYAGWLFVHYVVLMVVEVREALSALRADAGTRASSR